jgi:nucleoside-diphosphate kinase
MVENERLAFMATWLDTVSGVSWMYQLMVYPGTQEVELFDVKNRRVFLRKTKLEGLKPELYFVGASCTVLGRQLKIVDYGDEHTRKVLSAVKQGCVNLQGVHAFEAAQARRL